MDTKLVVVASYRFPMEAEMARIRLESVGIEAQILGAHTWTNVGIDVSVLEGGVRLLVREEDAERALKIIAEAGE